MSMTDRVKTAASVFAGTLNRYQLTIPSCTSPLDVEDFNGSEALSENYRYDIYFNSTDKDIDAASMLRKAATLTMGTGALTHLSGQKIVHGYITDFRRLAGSADQASYLIVIEPYLALLAKQYRTHRFFVNRSVKEVVQQILQEHGFRDWEYQFTLKQDYPRREQINQYQENDLQFIQRILAEVGIFYWFTLQKDTGTEVIQFGDSQSAMRYGKTLPLNSPSGMNDGGVESVWGLNITHNVVEAGVVTKDYNHRNVNRVLRSVPADMTQGAGADVNYGEVYHYRPRHPECGDKLTPAAETANFYARLDHERFLARQTLITGICNDAMLGPAQELTVTDGIVPTLPAVLREPFMIIRLTITASRKSALQSVFTAVPYSETLCWRPPLLPRPKVSGTMVARITSAKNQDIYAWQDDSGLYRVMFDADEESRSQGYESMPVRLAKPYGGDTYGFHFPLIQGTEVAIAFHEGDPDRPYIAHALHDARHPDHITADNHTRNVIRTAGQNKLRMEDKRGEEHIKLSTEYGGKTQLNLGHNVDARRALRGEGAELRTDKHIAVRGGAGVFISADKQPLAQGQMLDMSAALAQLQGALHLVTSLAESASTSGSLAADTASQQQLNSVLDQLKGAGLLASAPAGIGLVTPKNIQLSAGNTLTATAGKNVDMTIFKRLTIAAGEAISLFAQKAGMKIFAARGVIDLQAQTDAMRIQSQKTMNINSVSADIVLNAAQGITLMSGGAYIKIKEGAVEIGAQGKIALKSEDIKWGGSASLEQALSPATVSDPQYKFPMNGTFQVKDKEDGLPVPYIPYRIETDSGEVIRGVTDENGFTQSHHDIDPKSIKLFFE